MNGNITGPVRKLLAQGAGGLQRLLEGGPGASKVLTWPAMAHPAQNQKAAVGRCQAGRHLQGRGIWCTFMPAQSYATAHVTTAAVGVKISLPLHSQPGPVPCPAAPPSTSPPHSCRFQRQCLHHRPRGQAAHNLLAYTHDIPHHPTLPRTPLWWCGHARTRSRCGGCTTPPAPQVASWPSWSSCGAAWATRRQSDPHSAHSEPSLGPQACQGWLGTGSTVLWKGSESSPVPARSGCPPPPSQAKFCGKAQDARRTAEKSQRAGAKSRRYDRKAPDSAAWRDSPELVSISCDHAPNPSYVLIDPLLLPQAMSRPALLLLAWSALVACTAATHLLPATDAHLVNNGSGGSYVRAPHVSLGGVILRRTFALSAAACAEACRHDRACAWFNWCSHSVRHAAVGGPPPEAALPPVRLGTAARPGITF